MATEANYIPKSAKATDFKITLSKGASEDSERVSFLEQQIQQVKDTYESSLKNVIEECISLETSALQSQENETIYTLFASITEAINTLEGLKTDVHQKVTTARKAQPQRGRSTLKPRPKQQGSRQPTHQKGKADDTTNVVSNEHGRSSMRRRRS